MASSEVRIRAELDGLLLKLWNVDTDRLMDTINLQEHYGLSDGQAAQVLAILDERNKQAKEIGNVERI